MHYTKFMQQMIANTQLILLQTCATIQSKGTSDVTAHLFKQKI